MSTAIESTNGSGALSKSLSAAEAKLIAKQTPKAAGFGNFGLFLKHNMPALRNIAAKHLNPDRVLKILLNSVSKTPALQDCTNESILRACLQAVELGLEPGSALGEAYLVPFKDQCQLIPGYRGLVALAFRSSHVKSVRSKVVYQGDKFEYEDGLTIVLKHVPSFDAKREAKDITFAYCVINLRDGGVLCDVMTRGEIDAIRARSRAGGSGPWVTDYAEMAKKTVCRRCLKYAPMSVELSKALAADDAADTGDASILAEFESIDLEEQEAGVTKTERTKDKIAEPTEEELLKPFKLKADQIEELRTKVAAVEGGPTFSAFLEAAAAQGAKGFAELLKAASDLKEGQEALV